MKIKESNNRLIGFYDSIDDILARKCKVGNYIPLGYKNFTQIFQLYFTASPTVSNSKLINFETGSTSPLPLTSTTKTINGVTYYIVEYSDVDIVTNLLADGAGLYYVSINNNQYISDVFELTDCDPTYVLTFTNECDSLLGYDTDPVGETSHINRIEIYEDTLVDVVDPEQFIVERTNGVGEKKTVNAITKSKKSVSVIASSAIYDTMMLLPNNYDTVVLEEVSTGNTFALNNLEVQVTGNINECSTITYQVIFNMDTVENCVDCDSTFSVPCLYDYVVTCYMFSSNYFVYVQSNNNAVQISNDDITYLDQNWIQLDAVGDPTNDYFYIKLTCSTGAVQTIKGTYVAADPCDNEITYEII